MNALGSMWILLLILLVTSRRHGRSFLPQPIAGVTEMIQISIVGIVFSQLADAIRNGKLTRADSLLSWVAASAAARGRRDGGRLPAARRRLHGPGAVGHGAAAARGD